MEKVEVVGKFSVKIGDVELSLSKEEAESLYSALFAALGKINYNNPIVIKEIPYTPILNYPIWEYKPYEVYYTCNTNGSNDLLSLSYNNGIASVSYSVEK
jgi:hypothetical protein